MITEAPFGYSMILSPRESAKIVQVQSGVMFCPINWGALVSVLAAHTDEDEVTW